jgi:hypothetical protein
MSDTDTTQLAGRDSGNVDVDQYNKSPRPEKSMSECDLDPMKRTGRPEGMIRRTS